MRTIGLHVCSLYNLFVPFSYFALNYKLMTTSTFNISTYSRFNLSENESDIQIFVSEYRERIKKQLLFENEYSKTPFISFAEKKLSVADLNWLLDNEQRFFKNTPNERILQLDNLSALGFIFCMLYSPDGEHILVGYSTGLHEIIMDELNAILKEYASQIYDYYENDTSECRLWYPLFFEGKIKVNDRSEWVKQNYESFLRGTANKILYHRWYFSECGYITALEYSPNGFHVITGHSTGLIQMRHGTTGAVLATLRKIQFPPKPIYALTYSLNENRVCYAACMDGIVYRIVIPEIVASLDDPPQFCIRTDPALDCLNVQFYGAPEMTSSCTAFVTQRSPPLSLGMTADQTKLAVGYADSSIKIYDMETQECDLTYKVHKLRLQFIPKKLQRMHFNQVCALKCHDDRPFVFASAAWDKTLRIWDTRCAVGCMMTFEGVNVCSDSIDLKRDHCIAGSWQSSDALTVWDIVAKKRLSIVRVQNRRPDVDGEYIYACKYWQSSNYNRKGKYGIIGGSGTNTVEVINLHNRYITCSYPAEGSVLAITSHEDHIAFGGTAPVFTVVSFHDPKHEKHEIEVESDHVYTRPDPDVLFHADNDSATSHDDVQSVTSTLSAMSKKT